MKRIGILGAGAYGAAMAGVLRENGHRVKFYDPVKLPKITLAEVADWAEILLLATPAKTVKSLVKTLPKDKPLLVATKGLMSLRLYEKFNYFELISGPGFADDIRKRKKTKLTVAAPDVSTGKPLAEALLETSYLKFDRTEDLTGVALLSGLKNIYAIDSGRRGLKFDTPEFNAYIRDALKETQRFLLYNGGFVETVRLSAGVGDFVLTCGSNRSRNYQFGETLKLMQRGSNSRKSAAKFAKTYLKTTTVEGVFAATEIDRENLTVPKENEILIDILRRINHATQP